jgi:hypothetical protein
MTASSLSFKLAVLFVIAGIAMGIGMAASQDHSIMPAHAHLNLLGWVSLFLFGIYYERRPALDTSRLALIQVIAWSVGTVILTVAVAALHLGYTAFDPVAAIASLIVLAAMMLFAYFVFRPARDIAPSPTTRLTPAEQKHGDGAAPAAPKACRCSRQVSTRACRARRSFEQRWIIPVQNAKASHEARLVYRTFGAP